MITRLVFLLVLILALTLFIRKVKSIRRNILLGRDFNLQGSTWDHLKNMILVALGQKKLLFRPIPGMLHLIVYIGFIVINIGVLEIILDGLLGTQRIFSSMGVVYYFFTGMFEILAFGVLIACVLFLIRRNVLKIKRFFGTEMTAWPRSDANGILIFEIILMAAFLVMNASDFRLQSFLNTPSYVHVGAFPISAFIAVILPEDPSLLILLEQGCWWLHITGIFIFLNYLPYSKHWHIVMAFPNTYFANLGPLGAFNNMASITNEVKGMIDPNFSSSETALTSSGMDSFGAKDVQQLSRKSLMDAYSCTECGRCSSECPAHITGKMLSPRKILMDTRDRLEEVGRNITKYGPDYEDGKSLLDHYITREEIWACTTCNACVRACPIEINPVSIILELRRFLAMEEANAPTGWNAMFNNIENNRSPWKYSPNDRSKWINERSCSNN